MSFYKRYLCILFMTSMMSTTLESTLGVERTSSKVNVKDTDRESEGSRNGIPILEKEITQFGSKALSANPYLQKNRDSGLRATQENPECSNLSLSKSPKNFLWKFKTVCFGSNQLNESTSKNRSIEDVSQVSSSSISGCCDGTARLKIPKLDNCGPVSECTDETKESKAFTRLKGVVSRYFNYSSLEYSEFIKIHFSNFLKSRFSCCNSMSMDIFMPFVNEVEVYFRYLAVQNALIGKIRSDNLYKGISSYFDLSTSMKSPNISKYIFKTGQTLKKYSKQFYTIFPNFASYRALPSDKFSSETDPAVLKRLLDELFENSEKKVMHNLIKVVKSYLNCPCQKLSEEDKNAIQNLLYCDKNTIMSLKPNILLVSQGINLEEDADIFEQIYNNFFNELKGKELVLSKSTQAIEIKKLIVFVRFFMYQQDGLSYFEYMTLLDFMSKEYKKYKDSENKDTVNEDFYDSLCFFIQSFAYCEIQYQEGTYYILSNDSNDHKKGFRMLKHLFPNWEDLIQEENFYFLP